MTDSFNCKGVVDTSSSNPRKRNRIECKKLSRLLRMNESYQFQKLLIENPTDVQQDDGSQHTYKPTKRNVTGIVNLLVLVKLLLWNTYQDGELAGVQLTLEGLLAGVQINQALPDPGDLVLVVEGHRPAHVPLTGAQELHRRSPIQRWTSFPRPIYCLNKFFDRLKQKQLDNENSILTLSLILNIQFILYTSEVMFADLKSCCTPL